MGRSPGGNCFLRRIGRDKPDRAVMLYDDKTKERSTNTFYYRGGLKPSTVICEQVSDLNIIADLMAAVDKEILEDAIRRRY